MNVLVTSISRKVPLLQAVRRAINKTGLPMKLIGADMNPNCIGRYFVDEFWQLPSFDQLHIESFIKACQQQRIRSIIPTRDGELLYFASHRTMLEQNGLFVMVSHPQSVHVCIDKLLFYETLSQQQFPVIPTFLRAEDVPSDRYVVKERYGAGAKQIKVNVNKKEAIEHAKQLENPIFQPFVQGTEWSVDLYVECSGKVKGTVARTRDYVVAGESHITTTIKNERLEQMCRNAAERLQLYGHVVMQVIVDESGHFHFVECNSRFGGASTLSIEVGLDSFYWFLLESIGENINDYPFVRSENEKRQIRYSTDFIVDM